MVTNAVQDILNFNPFLMKNASASYWWGRDTILPICPKLIGGVLLYKDPIEEDVNNYYAPYTNELIGYSSNNVNTTTDIYRGSMNQTESKAINNGNGYKFVFDFGTSQANGLISSLGLTSFWGGREGYGSTAEKGIYRFQPGYSFSSTRFTSNEQKKSLSNIHYINYDQNFIYTAYLSAQNQITIEKYQMAFSKINLTTNDVIEKLLKRFSIKTTNFGTTSGVYITFFSDEDGYIWGFDQIGKNGNSSGNAILNWIKINPVTETFEEGTWELPITISSIGYNYNGWTLNTSYYRLNYSLLYNHYFYCFSYDKSKIYRININDINDIKIFMQNDGSTMLPSFYSDDYVRCYFQTLGNIIIFPGGFICNDKVYKMTPSTSSSYKMYGLFNNMSPNLQCGPFSFANGKYTDTATNNPYFSFSLMTPYLATINNLENPIEKTEDKTMKITYILTEVDEETPLEEEIPET